MCEICPLQSSLDVLQPQSVTLYLLFSVYKLISGVE